MSCAGTGTSTTERRRRSVSASLVMSVHVRFSTHLLKQRKAGILTRRQIRAVPADRALEHVQAAANEKPRGRSTRLPCIQHNLSQLRVRRERALLDAQLDDGVDVGLAGHGKKRRTRGAQCGLEIFCRDLDLGLRCETLRAEVAAVLEHRDEARGYSVDGALSEGDRHGRGKPGESPARRERTTFISRKGRCSGRKHNLWLLFCFFSWEILFSKISMRRT